MLNPKLNDPQMLESVETFLKAYKNLDVVGRKAFEVKIAQVVKGLDDNTKKLYVSLIQSARKGLGIREALAEMEKVGKG